MNDRTINEDIKDAIRFAQSMGVTDSNWVFLTAEMLQAVCDEVDKPVVLDELGRMQLGNYTFVVREGLEKALVLQPHTIPASFMES